MSFASTMKGKGALFATVQGPDGRTRDMGRIDRRWWAPRAWWYARVTFPRLAKQQRLRRLLGSLIVFATIFTSAGKAYVAAKLDGSNTNSPNKIGWGTGAGTAAIGDTTLFTEAAETRVTATLSRTTTTVTNDTFNAQGTLTSLSAQTITNAGLFDAASAGNLVTHADHTGLPLLTNDTINYLFTLKIA